MQILVNGHPQANLSVLDRGVAYGDGVFETIAIDQHKIQFWPQHWHRLSTGLQRLGFDCDLAKLQQAIEADILQLLKTVDQPRSVLKVTVTRGVGGRGYLPPQPNDTSRIVQISPWPSGREAFATTGVNVRLCHHVWGENKALAGLKHLNRLDQVLARQEWQDDSWQEGIMLNQQGMVQSGVMSNVFVEQHGQLYTPTNDGAGIDGIMSAQVQLLAAQLGIPVQQQAISLQMLESADAVFMTNSLNGIWPVVKYQQVDYAIGALTQRLQQALPAHIDAHSFPIANQ